MKDGREIAGDFDAIAGALAQGEPRGRLTSCERALLRHVPSNARTALDVGCGDGVASRALAARGLRVTALDLSPEMIALARARTPPGLGVRYRASDVMTAELDATGYDVVLSINMVHHLELATVVVRLAELVAPGGVLLVQDVVTRPDVRYLLCNLAGVVQRQLDAWRGRPSPSRRLRELYERHGRGETYLTPRDAEEQYRRLLPGTRVEHHLQWRYSAIWRRPAA